MKIAVAVEGRKVSQHFGHCEGFQIFEEKGGSIVMRQFIESPGHQPGFLPNFLNDFKINVIISGGMGEGAVQIFNEKGIKVITGASGDADEIAEKFIQGNLESTDSICREHDH